MNSLRSVHLIHNDAGAIQCWFYSTPTSEWVYVPKVDGDGKVRGPFPSFYAAAEDAASLLDSVEKPPPLAKWSGDPKFLRFLVTPSLEHDGRWCVLAVVKRGNGFEDTNLRFDTKQEALEAIGQCSS